VAVSRTEGGYQVVDRPDLCSRRDLYHRPIVPTLLRAKIHDSEEPGSSGKLELLCPACKASVTFWARFCKKCGTAIGPTKAAASTTVSSAKSQIIVAADGPASEALEGECKTVTALFADIKGSTELMEDLDPEEARSIVDPALKLMIDAVRRYDGYVVQSTGDGIFALLGAPVAHEDHPQRALYAALRMQQEVRRYADRQRAEGRAPIEIRVGVNTGEVVVRSITTDAGQIEYDQSDTPPPTSYL